MRSMALAGIILVAIVIVTVNLLADTRSTFRRLSIGTR